MTEIHVYEDSVLLDNGSHVLSLDQEQPIINDVLYSLDTTGKAILVMHAYPDKYAQLIDAVYDAVRTDGASLRVKEGNWTYHSPFTCRTWLSLRKQVRKQSKK